MKNDEKIDGASLLCGDASASQSSTEALPISVPVTTAELDWVLHAASLRRLTLVEYVRRAINLSLRNEGVDAVLLKESDDEYEFVCGHCDQPKDIFYTTDDDVDLCEECYTKAMTDQDRWRPGSKLIDSGDQATPEHSATTRRSEAP